MKVSNLIDMISLFAFGRVNYTDVEKNTFLKHLNLANQILYASVTNAQKLYKTVDLFLDNDEIGYFTKIDNIDVHYVIGEKPIEFKKYIEYLEDKNQKCYFYINDKLYVKSNFKSKTDINDNTYKPYITLVYTPNCKNLVEIVTNDELETDQPIYPEHLQNALIACAVYNLYLCEFGYAERIQYARADYLELRQKLMLFYAIEK